MLALALGAAPTMKDLTFLARDGCVNTPDMVNNLDDALNAPKLPKKYPCRHLVEMRVRVVGLSG